MKQHECPTCGQHYRCERTECGSPLVYDCFFCYISRHSRDLERASADIARRFGFGHDGPAFAELCFAD